LIFGFAEIFDQVLFCAGGWVLKKQIGKNELGCRTGKGLGLFLEKMSRANSQAV
jgi:hypothetical protein